jgi:hypothetical protein
MDFFHKLKSKKIQVSKTDDFGYDLRKKWEGKFASHLSPSEKKGDLPSFLQWSKWISVACVQL